MRVRVRVRVCVECNRILLGMCIAREASTSTSFRRRVSELHALNLPRPPAANDEKSLSNKCLPLFVPICSFQTCVFAFCFALCCVNLLVCIVVSLCVFALWGQPGRQPTGLFSRAACSCKVRRWCGLGAGSGAGKCSRLGAGGVRIWCGYSSGLCRWSSGPGVGGCSCSGAGGGQALCMRSSCPGVGGCSCLC